MEASLKEFHKESLWTFLNEFPKKMSKSMSKVILGKLWMRPGRVSDGNLLGILEWILGKSLEDFPKESLKNFQNFRKDSVEDFLNGIPRVFSKQSMKRFWRECLGSSKKELKKKTYGFFKEIFDIILREILEGIPGKHS